MPRYAAVTLCAHAPDAAICLGDSGAALVVPGTRVILGIASGGTVCEAGRDAVHTFIGARAIAGFIRSALAR